MKRIVIALAAAAVLAVGAVGAWNILDNSSVATVDQADGKVPRAEVEKQAKENFARPWEDAPESVSCPDGLRPKKYDTVRCQAVFKGERKPMLVSVTKVRGDKVNFDYGVLEKEEPGDDEGSRKAAHGE
ncbi:MULTISPECIES: DUF4333 domain-containing protein [Streptomyces]|uniref:DUF4333 domain-containing protein n=1 Tax=Streptomyces cacaoi TaxID=1898 RepID=A0A4Y3QRU4_STRCI|nr:MULTISPECIES: DUF4333 domain-containing protein [Streptomyces]NNG85055.1 DUF4333 domain-containing protein [Streptomyces cacaoi]QHF95842.1 DUF4333 domain-containing protein [Streptomyces sp. NHF165]GEB47659.1 hypothetical protein SCA03_02100 [Streptomyces cacaoi]